MSFEKRDLVKNREKATEKIKRINGDLDVFTSAIETAIEWLGESYAEIDRLTAAFNASEATLKDCQAENDRLTAMLDELRGKQAKPELVWKCPVSLKDGDYLWTISERLVCPSGESWSRGIAIRDLIGRDWTDPPLKGVWRVVEPGKAVWVRE